MRSGPLSLDSSQRCPVSHHNSSHMLFLVGSASFYRAATACWLDRCLFRKSWIARSSNPTCFALSHLEHPAQAPSSWIAIYNLDTCFDEGPKTRHIGSKSGGSHTNLYLPIVWHLSARDKLGKRKSDSDHNFEPFSVIIEPFVNNFTGCSQIIFAFPWAEDLWQDL